MKGAPIIFIMFAVVILALTIVGISDYYGESDWIWIANQITNFVLIFMVFGLTFYALITWVKR